jgi:hypothetical protein
MATSVSSPAPPSSRPVLASRKSLPAPPSIATASPPPSGALSISPQSLPSPSVMVA